MNRPAILATLALTLTACGNPPPHPEPQICGTVDNPTRVPDERCAGALNQVVDSPEGPVRIYVATDLACLDSDDYTPVGARVNDDYLGEPCDDDSERVAHRPTTTKTPTARKTTETKKPKPPTRSTR
jgi:hypothetical protein